MARKSVWLTYAWDDNKNSDVDFVAQELVGAGLEVKLDRWNLAAGKRLWEQIGSFIQDPAKSDGWILYATQASLGSEACKEEFAYALDRALRTRGGDFPVIALFPATVDQSLIPPGIKTRLFVSLTDPDWKERIIAAVNKREANIARPQIEPYELTFHRGAGNKPNIIELRPRAGTWGPFLFGIPLSEKDTVSATFLPGSPKNIPRAGMFGSSQSESRDKKYWITISDNPVTPSQSIFVFCKVLPSEIIFGVNNSPPQFRLRIREESDQIRVERVP